MKSQSIFILFATVLAFAACTKKTGAYEADGSKTTQTAAPVAGTANDISQKGTVPGSPSGVADQNADQMPDVKDFKATSVDPNDPSNKSDTAVKSGTSAEVNKFNSATTGGQNTSGTTSGARTAGKTSSGTSKVDGTSSSDSRNKGQ